MTVWQRVELRMHGARLEVAALEWDWVEAQLVGAGTYWTTSTTSGRAHPRPVWGVWQGDRLYLSVGTPATLQALMADPAVTVHLDSGTDVVIVEGRVESASTDASVIAAYDAKYDWHYDLATYGPLQCVRADAVLAWQAKGWAGREGIGRTGRWMYLEDPSPRHGGS
jgi:hypothetical protein